MKLIFLIFLSLAFSSFGQQRFNGDYNDGYKFIRKADKLYEKGKFSKSLKQLNRADQMDYGFCGNAWMEASESINTLRCKNYLELEQYSLARTYLDSIYSFRTPLETDSLRWKSYQLELGADSLSSIIDNSLENSIYVDSGFYHLVYIPLPNEFNFAKFTVEYSTIKAYKGENRSVEARKAYWISEFKKSTIYAMIKI